jgi:CheY-like chemotaxis protein
MEGKGEAGTGRRSKHLVLVVDNSQRDAMYTAMLLQNFGYHSAMMRTGEEALEMMGIAVPALVVTELVLPGMNGLDLFERLDRSAGRPALPVIVQTKFPDLETEDRCRRSGCAACLNKPVQSDELYRAVQQALEPTPRQNIRVPVLLKASVDGIASKNEFVTALSDAGLFVKTFEPHAAGSRHLVTFLLENRIIRADAVVLYAYRYEDDPSREPGMGMKFLNLDPVDRAAVQAYIRRRVQPGVRPEGAR